MELDPKQTGGVDFSEFQPSPDKYYQKNMLYYDKGEMTDKYFIKNAYVCGDEGNSFYNKGIHSLYLYNWKLAKAGDYVTTCPIKGTCFVCPNKDLAFGRINCVYGPVGEEEGGVLVGRADVVFL